MVHCAALVPHQVARAAFVAGRSHAQRMDEHDGADAWAARDRAKGRCREESDRSRGGQNGQGQTDKRKLGINAVVANTQW